MRLAFILWRFVAIFAGLVLAISVFSGLFLNQPAALYAISHGIAAMTDAFLTEFKVPVAVLAAIDLLVETSNLFFGLLCNGFAFFLVAIFPFYRGWTSRFVLPLVSTITSGALAVAVFVALFLNQPEAFHMLNQAVEWSKSELMEQLGIRPEIRLVLDFLFSSGGLAFGVIWMSINLIFMMTLDQIWWTFFGKDRR